MILAPVAREKKGEFLELFAEMQAQGYVRFRVDGQTYEYNDLPKLKKTEKHDIDVVIDRLRARPDMQQRLAESFEAALRLAEGRAIALEMARGRQHEGTPLQRQVRLPDLPLLAGRARAAPVLLQLAGGRLPELRRPGPPRVLRPAARGRLPLAEPGQRRHQGLGPAQRLLLQHAGERGQALQVQRRHALRGAARLGAAGGAARLGARKRSSSATRMDSGQQAGKKLMRKHPFEGDHPEHGAALPRDRFGHGARRARALSQPAALPRLRRHAPAPRGAPCVPGRRTGDGTRRMAIYEISRATLRESLAYFQQLQLRGAKAEIADKVVREIGLRLQVPQRRGPELPEPGPQRRDALGRRGAAHPPGLADRLRPHRRDVRAGRAQHRPAPARQRPADRHAQAPARHRQQRDRGRARRGHDPRGRPRDRHGPGRRRARRARDGAGHATREVAGHPDSLTGQYLSGAKKIAVPERRTPWLPVVAKPDAAEREEGLALPAEPGRRAARGARGRAPRDADATCRRSAWSAPPATT